MIRRILTLSIALVILVAPASTRAQSGGWIDMLTAVLPDAQRIQTALTTLGADISDADALDELDDAAADMQATLESNPPEACWANWWGDTRAAVMLLGEVHDALDAMDADQVTAFLTAGSFLLTHANDNFPEGCS